MIDRTPGVNSLGVEQPYLFVSRKMDNKTGYIQNSYKNQQISGGATTGKNKYTGAIYETVTMPFPETLTISYRAIIWTNFIEQANDILETVWHNFDYGLSFKFPVHNFGNEINIETKEPAELYLVGHVDPTVNHESNFEDYSRDERVVKYSYEIKVFASTYIWPKNFMTTYGKDEKGKRLVERQYSPYKIVFDVEEE
jgi:hypothetical protein